MKWNSPEFMLLALLIPLIAFYKYLISDRAKKGGINFPLAGLAGAVKSSLRTKLRFIPDLIRLRVYFKASCNISNRLEYFLLVILFNFTFLSLFIAKNKFLCDKNNR